MRLPRTKQPFFFSCVLLATILGWTLSGAAEAQTCARTLTADVVAFDQVFFWNRLGAVQPQGMMFALRRDVVPISGASLSAGNVRLRPDKRPRPIVLRMNVGDCLQIHFQNLLSSTRRDQDQSATRQASIHAVGLHWVVSEIDDGAYVGQNANSLVNVGGSAVYTLYGEREGEHVLYSAGALAGGQGDGGHVNSGLFGAIIVEPQGSRWYRSQVTRQEMTYASTGTTPAPYNQPIIDYEAVYPVGHPRAGTPVLNMLQGNEIVHTDLTAIIAGSAPNGVFVANQAGWFPPGTFPLNQFTHPQREQPFREFTIIYHDEIGAVQAFREFEQAQLAHTLHSGRDAFAINYGTGGIGAEVLANRFRVGPMWNCVECKLEEFFLSSWAVGDPAMVVDKPANVPCGVQTTSPNTAGQDPNLQPLVQDTRDGDPCVPLPNPKATKAFFPDDPSNVYHSYLNDHTRFRVLHAGSKEHHIHHLHAHQWLFTADSDKSSYLDSQAIGPGASFTAEIAYHGGGNLNRTPGDAIFHCHFYPHFAQGMWSLWRVHDVFERGTILDPDGKPAEGENRALPDGEIARGTPIPAVVPLPGRPMAPLPGATVTIANGQATVNGAGNPGFPFFIPALAGHRPPKPPLDTLHDGGLVRHRIDNGTVGIEEHTRLSFRKELAAAVATALPEPGTTHEQQAMTFHELPFHNSCEPSGLCNLQTRFATNGRPRIAGAPLADPCSAEAAQSPRTVKGADIQDDVKINKAGWHFPQTRFSALWDDVDDYLALTLTAGGATPSGNPKRPPEPLFFRANSETCINFWFTSLVPKEYELDDFQVTTPTDILGQHIHLVKFDVLASDGAANGFNYEDGSFSPGEVRERVAAIRAQNGCTSGDPRNGTFPCPVAAVHPFFGAGPDADDEPGGDWIGAQTTIQRWWADPVRDNAGNDRTLRTVFTHDHFGPSTHQQAGLYAGLVVEPKGSSWFHNETGAALGPASPRHDGGPTTWQAIIDPQSGPAYREFLLQLADFQLAYEDDNNGFPDPDDAVNPPGRMQAGLPDLLQRPNPCPESGAAPPCPELVSADDVGTMSVNYRHEPLALRVRQPSGNTQAAGQAGDLSWAFSSLVTRADSDFNVQPTFYPPLTQGLAGGDPFTPLLRAYETDRVQVRVLVGAHEEGHNFSIHGVKWLFEPSEPNSGFRNSQMMGISEHFEMIIPPTLNPNTPQGDYVDRLWMAGSATDDLWNGMWGLLRGYTEPQADLAELPDDPPGIDPDVLDDFGFSCPNNAPIQTFSITAVAAKDALRDPPHNGRLVYNDRVDGTFGTLFDPTAILYFRTSEIDFSSGPPKLKPGAPIEPLILRARAGDCIKLTLLNHLPTSLPEFDGFNTLPMVIEGFNANDIAPSPEVGLHPQLLYYDVSRFDGANVGQNAPQTVQRLLQRTYEWYAGELQVDSNGNVTAVPIEFGATNLISSDRIEHASKGAIGALIIEPQNALINDGCVDPPFPGQVCTRTMANVTNPNPQTGQDAHYRDFVVLFQNDVNMRSESLTGSLCGPGDIPPPVGTEGWPVENLGCEDDPEDSGQKAINFRTEPLWKRMQHAPGTPFETTDDFNDWWDVLSNTKVGANPETSIFLAGAGEAIRFRVLQPGGHARNIVFSVHGHEWDKEPYQGGSTRIGRNSFSFWEGARTGHGPTNHVDAVVRFGAGGKFSILGDYLVRDQVSPGLDNGLWGLLRVE